MATIPVTCNACGNGFDVDARKAGLSSPCPNCHARVDVPDDAGAWPASPVAVALATRGQRDLPLPTKSRPPAPPSVVSLTTVSTTAPAASPAQSVDDIADDALSAAPSIPPAPLLSAAAPPVFPNAPVAVPVAQSVNHPPIACPYCSQPMVFAADLVGSPVACVRCGQSFTMPTVGQPAMPSLVGMAAGAPRQRRRRRRRRRPRSDFFDIGAFWTPRLIRSSWRFALLLAALALVAVIVVAVWFVREGDHLLGLLEFLGGIAAIWLVLCWYRIRCEFTIVTFDIAETLAEIRDDLRDQQ